MSRPPELETRIRNTEVGVGGDNAVTRPLAFKGRGTALRLQHRFEAEERAAYDDGWGNLSQVADEQAVAPNTTVIEEPARRIVTRNDSPDINFDLSINPYRGCEHGCIYCYARPTHSYLGMSPGLDFETRIVAKVNAAERLRAEFDRPGYRPRSMSLGSATDAYQPIERRLQLTRSVIEVLSDYRHAFGLVTKSAGVLRDLDLLGPMGRDRLAAVYLSITTLDPALARIMEPRAASPARRLEALARLADAGVPTGVSVSPLIPFVNDSELEHIMQAAAAAGATRAFSIVLRLPWEVNPLFKQWLEAHFADRADRIMSRVRDLRGGRDYDARFGQRMTGQGIWADLIRQRFERAARALGLNRERHELDLTAFRRPPGTSADAVGRRSASAGGRRRSLGDAEPHPQQPLF